MNPESNHESTPRARVGVGLFDRGGHLTALALDRHRLDPEDVVRAGLVEAHLAGCERCAAALAAADADAATFALAPSPAVLTAAARAPVRALRASRPRRLVAAGAAVLALAAALALAVLRPWEPGDPAAPDTRLRGGAFDLEVWVHDGEAARPVATGDAIRPGDRVGFRVKARADGHLLVAGVDREGHVYVCYPQGASDGSAPFAATAEPVELDQAMRFDAVPGEERLVAFFCDVPITLAEVAPRLRAESTALTMADALPRLRADCAQEEVVLRKTGAGGPR